jgi:tetratricopeptide (TPR) repeat protein
MAQEKMYQAALEAIDQGQTIRARDLFTRLLRSDSSRAEYWLWMSTLVDTKHEQVYCLESTLRADPDNEAAKRGLVILGARETGKDVAPSPLIHRNWERELEDVAEPQKPLYKRVWDNRTLRRSSLFVAGIIVIGIIIGGASLIFRKPPPEPLAIYKVSPFPTRTPSPTLSPNATRTLAVRTPTPTFIGPTPLWMLLTATYTPIPPYVNTPHPVTDAYRAGMRAYENSDWNALLNFMQQALAIEPDSPDLYYYLGEAYRNLGRPDDAVEAYGQALKINSQFAPAYLGRALAYESINPQADIEGEISYALDFDPNYVDAYLARARIRIEHHNPQGATDDILAADKLFTNHPMVYVLLAQVYLEYNDPTTALEYALTGYELDKTSLPAYLTLAKVYLAKNDSQKAIHYIEIYLSHARNDAEGYAIKAQAEFQIGNFNESLAAADLAIAADEYNAPSWYYRGIINLDRGDVRTAVNDLVNAVNLDMQNFDYSIALGNALWADERLDMAIRQFTSAKDLATTERQLAVIYYNRARIYEQAESLTNAMEEWNLLLALPSDQVPAYWRTVAREHLDILNPPTPTQTPTLTPTPTETATPTPTETATPTETLPPTAETTGIATISSMSTPSPSAPIPPP